MFSLISLFTESCFPVLLLLPYPVFLLKEKDQAESQEFYFFSLWLHKGENIIKYNWKITLLKLFNFQVIADLCAFARNSIEKSPIHFTQSSSVMISCVPIVQYQSQDSFL